MKEKLFKKFLKFSYGSWIGLLIGLFTTMIITRILSPDDLGKASMFDLVVQVGLILTIFGTDQAFVRFFYEEDEDKRGALLFNSLKTPILSSIILIFLIFMFYPAISHYLFDEKSFLLIILLAVGIVFQLLLRYGQLVIRMQQKGNLFSLINIFQKLFYLLFVLLLAFFWQTDFEILIISKVMTLILVAIIAIYFGKNFWSLKNLKVKGTLHTQKDILKFGAPFVITIFISWLFEAFDKIALREWSTFEELGLYTAAMRLVALVLVLKATFSSFWTPVAYEKFEKNPNDKDFFKKISTVVSFVLFFVAIISIGAKDVIVLIFGEDYREASKIMPFLVFIPVLYTISETTVMGINFYKKIKWHIFIASAACVANIIGNSLLVPGYGALGASISTALSYLIFFSLRTYISSKYFKVRYPLKRIYLMIIIIGAYGSLAIQDISVSMNLFACIASITILVILFYKDLRGMPKKIF